MELAKPQLTKPISMEIALCIIRMFNLRVINQDLLPFYVGCAILRVSAC